MPRPRIDFLQSQALPWEPSPWPYLPGCQVKPLSRDSDTGAVSVLVRFPSGWSAAAPGALATTEELLVLDGLLELGGRRYAQDCYGWFPTGSRHHERKAEDGAVALVFFGAEPVCSADAAAPARPAAEAVFIDAFERPWTTDAGGAEFGGSGRQRKVLRGAPAGGAVTMLIASPPHRHPPSWRGPQELHACAEEMYLLCGDLLTPTGAMAAGAYCSRPPGGAHGPYASRGGAVALVRTAGAPLATGYTAHELELERSPAYQPLLPDAMRALATRPWRPQRY